MRGVLNALCMLILLTLTTLLHGQTQTERIGNKLKIVFEEFNRIDDRKYHTEAQVDIASLIKLGLMEVPYLEFVGGSSKNHYDDTSNKHVYALTEDQYDISVYGSYAFYEDTFMIDVNLFGAKDHSVVKVNPIIGSLDQLYHKVEGLKGSIINAIKKKWLYQIANKKKIAIICQAKNNRVLKELDVDYVRQVTLQITKAIDEHAQISLTPWSKAASYYLSNMEPSEIAKSLQVDALLIANIDVIGKELMIYPRFYIKDSDELIELGVIEIGRAHV